LENTCFREKKRSDSSEDLFLENTHFRAKESWFKGLAVVVRWKQCNCRKNQCSVM